VCGIKERGGRVNRRVNEETMVGMGRRNSHWYYISVVAIAHMGTSVAYR
jgi:hypothetical protein